MITFEMFIHSSELPDEQWENLQKCAAIVTGNDAWDQSNDPIAFPTTYYEHLHIDQRQAYNNFIAFIAKESMIPEDEFPNFIYIA